MRLLNDRRPLQTLYFSKLFTSGLLKGITVHEHITASPSTLAHFTIGHKGRSITGARFVIVDASYQNYVR